MPPITNNNDLLICFLLVMEVVTGEYGNFTSQLKTAAIDNSWRTPPQISDSSNIYIL